MIKVETIIDTWLDKNPNSFKILADEIVPALQDKQYYPKTENILRAFKETPYEDVKVVILGQDPYHDGSATGLAFDNVGNRIKISPSLRNIMSELVNEGFETCVNVSPAFGSRLGHLPEQGVLLLNTALTVEPSNPGSHAELWKPFTVELIKELQNKDNIVWILWGKHAQSYKEYITNETHKTIESAHPSPFSASKGFFGSKPFSKCNGYLKELGLSSIKW